MRHSIEDSLAYREENRRYPFFCFTVDVGVPVDQTEGFRMSLSVRSREIEMRDRDDCDDCQKYVTWRFRLRKIVTAHERSQQTE